MTVDRTSRRAVVAARRGASAWASERVACVLLLAAALASPGAALAGPPASASSPPLAALTSEDERLAAREAQLAHQLRCVVCQNQTIAESNAPLAADMRAVVREQLHAGRSDADILAFFEARYGAFIRYSPPWTASTWLLWLGPFVVLALGTAVLFGTLRRRQLALSSAADVRTSAEVTHHADEATLSPQDPALEFPR